jgi:hypothetical protein
MRRSTGFLVPLAASCLVALTACDSNREPSSPSFAEIPGDGGGTGGCNISLVHLGGKVLTVNRWTTNNNASWHIINNGSSAVTLTGQTLTKSGKVIAVRPNSWAPFPYNLAGGTRIDADLRFDVGGVGTGSVGMTVSSSCGNLVLPPHPVQVQ